VLAVNPETARPIPPVHTAAKDVKAKT
jgi:hypothetical protein